MSNASSKHTATANAKPPKDAPPIQAEQPAKDTKAPKIDTIRAMVTWRPWLGVIFVIVWFFLSQLIAGLLIVAYPSIRGFSEAQTNDWLGTVTGQFVFISLAEALSIYGVYWFLKINKATFAAIGLIRPRWRDFGIGLLAVPTYFLLYLATVTVVTYFYPDLNVDQHQDVGFETVKGSGQLLLTFISLAVLPPLTEEIMVRGLLYSSFKKWLPTAVAVLLTSGLFAVAHLPEGGSAGPLYIAAIDTFVLSLVLIYLREKTGSLWASITLHFVKNSIAFLALYVFVTA